MAGAQIEQFQYGESTLTAFITVFNAALLGGFNLTLDAFFTTAAPTKINAGWSLELGGAVYYSAMDEIISGSISAGKNYIRAAVAAGAMTFEFTTTDPAWDAAKCGWYNAGKRYVAEVYQSGTTYTKQYLTGENNGAI